MHYHPGPVMLIHYHAICTFSSFLPSFRSKFFLNYYFYHLEILRFPLVGSHTFFLPLDNNVVKYVLMYFHITISSALKLSVLLKNLSLIIMHCQRLSPHGAHTFHLFATPTSAAGWLAIKSDGHKLSKISIVFSEVSNLNFLPASPF